MTESASRREATLGRPNEAARAGDALARLSEHVAEAAREELTRVRAEVRATLRRAGRGGALLGAAGLFGVLAIGTGSATALRALESVLPRGRAAAALTLMYLGTSGVLAVLGVKRLREAADRSEQVTHEIRRAFTAQARSAVHPDARPPAHQSDEFGGSAGREIIR